MANNLRVEFFKTEAGLDVVEIKRVGDLNTVLEKVENKRDFLAEFFPRELAAYDAGKNKPVKPRGMALTVLKGMTKRRAAPLVLDGVETIEQLADLSDASCNALGSGMMEFRKSARTYLAEMSGERPRQVVG